MSSVATIRTRAQALGQMAVMAAIVATMLFFPVGIALAIVLALAGSGLEALVTFGGALGMASGVAVWWLLFFAGGVAYAACLSPAD